MTATDTPPTAAVTAGPGELDALLAELASYRDPGAPRLSLSPRAFTSPELYELEQERIFARSWVMVAHTDQLTRTGDYVAVTVAGEPVLVTRGDDGRLHGMSPICRHRMMPLLEPGAGNVANLTCPYHLWRYRLDGSLLAATHMRDNLDFDPSACRLPRFAVEQWHGMVFVNLDPFAESVGTELRLASEQMVNYRLDDMVQILSWSEIWNCNWKVAVENGHENYHAIGLHPETVKPLMSGRIDMTVHEDTPLVTRLLTPIGTPADPGVLPLTEQERSVLYSFRLFPCSSVATFGESVAWITLIPLSLDRTEVRGGTLMPSALVDAVGADVLRAQVQELTGAINDEDRRGLEAVQRGATSRFTGRGHLSPKEPGVDAFYRRLAEALASP